ncbi:ABC transporter ATP-binding protein [Listeria booriae]|uniref:ABC transporter ATP-binding protein n=1 Tax=Listeria booriae TaxID=1552123 RepID=UPI0016274312|nr:ABC transporter ATP-binding protein [Listeria booriae]MBC1892047.1 ABC transporter ATP-binding protein [Listeria booriae]MBC1913412.1 ABC transporter ATP-binding protein [Listeria booriae]MBC2057255.1 ABC transporter ATP-binding protein [Listeria booriae]
MIRFEKVTKQYQNGEHAVNNVDLNIKDGEFFVFIGPSGCGKTTTLKMINRLIPLTTGTIYIDEKRISDYNIHELRWNIGYVLQQIALFPHMTIEENIAIVPELKKWDKDKIHQRITELLDSVGLDAESYRNRKPAELSGGEQQRVGVVRALAADPEIILMDEPFSALDPISRQKLQQDMIVLQRKIKKTIVFVTHDMQEALMLGDRICIMKDGEVVQCDTPNEILQNPANEFVQNFLESGNVNKHVLSSKFTVRDMVEQGYFDVQKVDGEADFAETIAVEVLLQQLANQTVVSVELDGKAVGLITQQHVIQFLANQLAREGEHV